MSKLNWDQLIQWDKDDLINYIENLQLQVEELDSKLKHDL
jgi:hypothetical protein